jgi:RNA polymerase sigma factor (TIGR02999 family)
MSDVTHILAAIEQGDPSAAEQLLPLVYDELRKLAAAKLAHENPGQTLSATGLVHEAYIRLVDSERVQQWNSRGHFFAAAAEAMRRILVDNARRKRTRKPDGGQNDVTLDQIDPAMEPPGDDLLALDEALVALEAKEPIKAEVVKLRFFAGLTMAETAATLGISVSTAENYWTYARAWLRVHLAGDEPPRSS